MRKSLHFWALAVAMFLPMFATAQTHSLTVADGTDENLRIPVYGYYAEQAQQCQIVYSAAMIEAAVEDYAMTGGSINSMTFYLGTQATNHWDAVFEVRLMSVPGTTISGFANTSGSMATLVFVDTLDGTHPTMTVNFSTPYTYNGGNLLVEFKSINPGEYYTASFTGLATEHTTAWAATANGSGSGFNFIPKTTFSFTGGTAVTCPSVSNLAISDVTSNSMTLSWTASSVTGTTYSVYDASDTTLVASGITGNSYTATGLTPNTLYEFIVEANCPTGSSLWRTIGTHTECAVFSLPYSTGFEDMTPSVAPRCWEVLGGECIVHENTNYAYRGDQFLDFRGSTDNIMVMPPVDEPLSGKQVRFWTRPENYYTYCGSLSVGYITDLTDLTTFVPLETYSYTLWEGFGTEYFEEIVEFGNNVPANARVAFRHNPTNSLYYWYVDDVVLEVQPTCSRPINFHMVSATDTSLTLAWSDTVHTGITYTLRDYYDSTILASGITGTTYTLTGLTPNTLYTISLAANCTPTDESLWTTIDVRTECGILQVPYFTDFEEMNIGSHPFCWEHLNHLSSMANVCQVAGYGEQKGLRFNYSISQGNVIALPEFNTPVSQLRMRFEHKSESMGANYCGNLEVGYLTDATDANSFVAIATLDRTTEMTRAIVNFETAPDTVRMALRHVASGLNWYWIVDDVHVEPIPTCRDITSLELEGVTSDGVTVQWNYTHAANYLIEARQGDSVVSSVLVGSDSIGTITGLTLNENYDIYVRGICGNDSSFWSEPLAVHVGYCAPAPGTVDGQGIINVTYGYDEVVNNSNHPLHAPYYGDYSDSVGDLPLSMPVDVAITFNTGFTYGTIIWIDFNNDYDFEDNEIVYTGMSDNAAPTTLHATFTLNDSIATGYYRMRIGAADLDYDSYVTTGSGYHDPCNLSHYNVYMDYTVHVVPAPPCIPVSNVTVSDITATGATLSWEHFGTATFTIYNGTTVVASGIDSTHFTLTGLTPTTYYALNIEANCPAGDDAMLVPVSFATLCDGNLSLPFLEGFGPESATRGCWEISSNNAENAWETSYGMNYVKNEGNYLLRFSSYNETAGDYTQYAYSPVFNAAGADAVRIRIRYSTYTTSDNLYFGYVNATGTVWDETPYFTTGTNDMAIFEAYVPNTAHQIVIRYFGDFKYFAFVDSVEVTAAVVNDVTLESADPAMGDVYPEGTTLVPVGGSFTATAVPAEDYHFLAWMNGTTVVSTENPYTFVPTADITLTAAFEHNVMYYTVSVSCDTNKGTVDGTGTFEEGTEVTLTVNPKEGYAFAGWLEGSDLIEENPLTFTLTADRSLVVVFRTAGIDDVEGSSLALYPNPATTSVTLEGLANGSRVTLLSLNGRECGQWTAVDGKLTLDLSALAKGAYFVRVVSNNNTAVRKLIVK